MIHLFGQIHQGYQDYRGKRELKKSDVAAAGGEEKTQQETCQHLNENSPKQNNNNLVTHEQLCSVPQYSVCCDILEES